MTQLARYSLILPGRKQDALLVGQHLFSILSLWKIAGSRVKNRYPWWPVGSKLQRNIAFCSTRIFSMCDATCFFKRKISDLLLSNLYFHPFKWVK